jgi:hypothetical protein
MTATLRTDFDAFLFAPIGEDTNGIPLTLLTVLARLGVDPWEEAADLAHLALEPALQRLTSRLEAMPNGRPATAAETVNIATRLIALLHRAPEKKPSAPQALPMTKMIKHPDRVKLAVYFAIAMGFILVGEWAMSVRDAPAPMDTAIAPDSPG